MSTPLHSNTAHAPSGDGTAARVCENCEGIWNAFDSLYGGKPSPVAMYDVRFTDGTVRYGVFYCNACVETPDTLPDVDVLLLRESVPARPAKRMRSDFVAALVRDLGPERVTPATAADQRRCIAADREARRA